MKMEGTTYYTGICILAFGVKNHLRHCSMILLNCRNTQNSEAPDSWNLLCPGITDAQNPNQFFRVGDGFGFCVFFVYEDGNQSARSR